MSYGHGDAAWVEVLAANLTREGLYVFLDKWEVIGGDQLARRLEGGIGRARTTVLVVSPLSMSRPWVNEEINAAIARAVAGEQRLIPVLLGDVDLPPFIAGRAWIDFRYVDSPDEYKRRFGELVRAIRGSPPGQRPEPGGEIVTPDLPARPEGPRLARLRITASDVRFSTAEREEQPYRHGGLDQHTSELIRQVRQARAGLNAGFRHAGAADDGDPDVLPLEDLGRALGQIFLGDRISQALAAEAISARHSNSAFRLAVEVDDPSLSDLPWETLTLPGQAMPLVLQDRIELYRSIARAEPVPAINIPGPLRILAVICSPERGRGELLDYEAELARILDIVNPTRRNQSAYIRVLNWGSPSRVRAALLEERFHILHISCHAEPGVLIMEDDGGEEDRVDAARFARDVLVADRGIPLIVLAGCSTAVSMPQGHDRDALVNEPAYAGLARELLHRGVPAVIAMTAPVTDRYAIAIGGRLYRELAARASPQPLAALSEARRQQEDERRVEAGRGGIVVPAEWSTPTLFLAGPSLPMFHAEDGYEEIYERIGGSDGLDLPARRIGEFVGRRAELRQLLRTLRQDCPGVILHGIGGVGKSSLTAQLIDDLGRRTGLIVCLTGPTSPHAVLQALRIQLLSHCLERGLGEGNPIRRIAAALRDPSQGWQEMLSLLAGTLFPRLPVLLILDNFEDNLVADGQGSEYRVRDEELASFIAAWLRSSPLVRLLVTSRYPFQLPGGMERRMTFHHLGPLSEAETRKMFWRLPALDALSPEDQKRAYTDVGGHPRTLEYLDALLRGGSARFHDVAERVEDLLRRRSIDQPGLWLRGMRDDLDRALAEAVTLAADDVLLKALLERVDSIPLARAMLDGVSVYRRPVEYAGVAWMVSENESSAEAPHSTPFDAPEDTRQVLNALLAFGLITPVKSPLREDEDQDCYVVHRWTASRLGKLIPATALAQAHAKAASYLSRRVQTPQDAMQDILTLIEARYHYSRAGQVRHIPRITGAICDQLERWGAWDWVEQLCSETLEEPGLEPLSRGAFLLRMGAIARNRGDYRRAEELILEAIRLTEQDGNPISRAQADHEMGLTALDQGKYESAEQWLRKSMTLNLEADNPYGIGADYGSLGSLATDRGDYKGAEEWYRMAVAADEAVDNMYGVSASYHNLSGLAIVRGSYQEAEDLERRSLAINQQMNDPKGIAANHHNLGRIAFQREDYAEAERSYQQELNISEQFGIWESVVTAWYHLSNVALKRHDLDWAKECANRALSLFQEKGHKEHISRSHHQLGIIAQERGDLAEAESHYRISLDIKQEADDRAGIASTCHQLGEVAYKQERYEDAERWYRQAMALNQELGRPGDLIGNYHMLGLLAARRADIRLAENFFQRSLALSAELGSKSMLALTSFCLGELLAGTARPAEAVRWILQSMVIHQETRSDDIRGDILLLYVVRSALGDQKFADILRDYLGPASVTVILTMTSAGRPE